ncbi:hypothetical protein ACO0QE_003298 [Hanseniaspora vineae]
MFSTISVDETLYPLSDKVTLPEAYFHELLENKQIEFDTSKPVILELQAVTADGTLHGKCFCGVREFSLKDPDEIQIPFALFLNLDLSSLKTSNFHLDAQLVNQEIPGGTEISLEPLGEIQWSNLMENSAVYLADEYKVDSFNKQFIDDDSFVKHFLEARFNNTLTFKIHELKPSPVICIVNVDLSLNIVHQIKIPVDKDNKQIGLASHVNAFIGNSTNGFSAISIIQPNEEITITNPQLTYQILLEKDHALQIVANDIDESFQLFVGSDEKVGSDCFKYSSMGHSCTKTTGQICSGATFDLPACSDPYFIRPTLNQNTSEQRQFQHQFILRPKQEDIPNQFNSLLTDVPPGFTLCPHCNKSISETAFLMHELRCQKNISKCSQCHEIFEAVSPGHLAKNHWHCNELHEFHIGGAHFLVPECHGESQHSYKEHCRWFHDLEANRQECDWCLDFSTNSLYALGLHKEYECPEHPKLCRFCNLIVSRGERNFETDYFGLTGLHEFQCGSKTNDCYKCGNKVRQFEMEQHLLLHKMQLKNQVLNSILSICSNKNCCNVIENQEFNNKYQLCNFCYSKFYSTDEDKDGKRFRMRLERSYVLQLTKGCGYTHCKNTMCRSSGMAQSFANVKEVLMFIQNKLLALVSTPEFYLCVDDSITKKKLTADIYLDNMNSNEYAQSWVYKAVNSTKSSSLETLDEWLHENALGKNDS